MSERPSTEIDLTTEGTQATVEFSCLSGRAVYLELVEDGGDTAGVWLDRDEAQTYLDGLIEVLEAYDEETAPKPPKALTVDDLEVGKAYRIVADESGHDFHFGQVVIYLGPDAEGLGDDHLLVTTNATVTEWEASGGRCRAALPEDLAEITL